MRFSPDSDTLANCEIAAIQFAQQLRRRLKQQVPRQAVNDAQTDRTAQAIGRIIGSLCVATMHQGNQHCGILTAWVTQATFAPPGLMLALPTEDSVFSQLSPGMPLVLNILKEGRAVRRHFSFQESTPRAFASLETRIAENGCLVLTDALAYLECTIQDQVAAGDHQLIYARINHGQLLARDGMTAIQHRKSGSQY